MKTKIMDHFLKDKTNRLFADGTAPEYTMVKYNLLKNEGRIDDDQMPHRDYPPRLAT